MRINKTIFAWITACNRRQLVVIRKKSTMEILKWVHAQYLLIWVKKKHMCFVWLQFSKWWWAVSVLSILLPHTESSAKERRRRAHDRCVCIDKHDYMRSTRMDGIGSAVPIMVLDWTAKTETETASSRINVCVNWRQKTSLNRERRRLGDLNLCACISFSCRLQKTNAHHKKEKYVKFD